MQDPKNTSGPSTTGTSRDPWLPLLAKLPLSRTEKEVVRRYEGDPQGRAFLPVADILRSHRLVDESLELLTQGVERHPAFTVARVVLARELLQKGLIAEAWRALEESPVSLRDNLLAQKLRFRLALLLSLEAPLRATYQHLTTHQMLDSDTKRLGDLLELAGLEHARDKLIKDLKERGIDVVLPAETPIILTPVSAALKPRDGDPVAQISGTTTSLNPDDYGARDAFDALADWTASEDDIRLSAFHVVPLDEIFHPGGQGGQGDESGRRTNNAGNSSYAGSSSGAGQGGRSGSGIELDSTTLAEIYARQGHYGKALAVYRRLLRLTPHNELLRRKLAELVKLEREQRDVDLTVDPALVDRMEAVEIIDRQIKFYNDLLSRLT